VLPKIFKPYKSLRKNLVRIGPKKDGGYIIDKRVIKKSGTIITCGLNDDWEFEKDFLKFNKNCKIIAYDHTVNEEFWNKRFKKNLIDLLKFKKLNIKKITDIFKHYEYRSFFKNKNNHYIKKVVLNKKNRNEVSIKQILSNQKNIILKVDIEGDEYNLLNKINKEYKKINLLIIEFHKVSKNINKIKKFILSKKFKIIHIHANNFGSIDKNSNPNVLEITLINHTKFKTSNLKSNIEKIFKVNVTKINIINKQSRTKFTRGRKTKVSGFKKAIVTLKKGQSIDLTTGI